MEIFVSYRRSDSADVSGRIYDRLVNSFGEDTIFKDVDNIPFGVNFKTYLSEIIEKSKIILVVIGPSWLNVKDDKGQRRLDNPSDFVRIEIEVALKRKIIIIPLLVSGASMPDATQLPSALEELAFYNGTKIRPDPDFHKDMDRLIHEIGNQKITQKRKSARFPYSQTGPTYKSLLNLSLSELAFLGKDKFLDFVNFLPTPWGRFVLGTLLGWTVAFAFYGFWDFINLEWPYLVEDYILWIGFCWGIAGAIFHPRRKPILYAVFGTFFGAIIVLLASILLKNNFLLNIEEVLGIIASCIMFVGTLVGAIIFRIQIARKKVKANEM